MRHLYWNAVLLVTISGLSAATIRVPDDYSSIQAALTAAQSGDTVLVQPGTYYENIFWPDVNGIKLISAGDSSNTIIDGGGNGSVVYMNPSTATIDGTTEIRGFKITNGGNIANGGGMFVSNASPVFTQLWVTGNAATNDGGGFYIGFCSPTITYVTVTGNSASSSSRGGGGLYILSSSPTLTDVTVTDNTATEVGGGLYILSSNPTLTDMTLSSNTARIGGGLFIGISNAMLTDVTVTGNTARDYGGGVYISGGNSTLTNVTVTGNTTIAAFGSGGGLSISGGSPTLIDVTLSSNTAIWGGGLYISGGDPTLMDVTLSSNTASRGGGLSISGGDPSLTDVTVTSNTASRGGGFYISGGDPTLTDVTVTGNTANEYGGGLYIKECNPSLTDVTVTSNTASSGGGGFYISGGDPTLTRITVSRNLGEGLYFRYGSGALVNVTITGNTSGIYVESGTPTIAGSNIAYHGSGLYNADNTNTIDATNNWWGNSSGPYHPLQNAGGLGNSVNAFVNITPWLAEPNTAAPPIPVQNLVVANQGDDFIELAWDASPIGDLAGYKIYFDTDSKGFPYADTIDVGNNTSYTLSGLSTGLKYYIAATCYDTDGNESWYSNEVSATPTALAVDESAAIPTSFALHANYPNPFNPITTIRFDLPHSVDISIVVYDLLGREVVRLMNGRLEAGYQQVVWDGRTASGREIPTGIYIARLVTPEYRKSIKMVLLK